MKSTERVQALRDRRKAEGLSEVRGIWAPPDQHARIKREAMAMRDLMALVKMDQPMPEEVKTAMIDAVLRGTGSARKD